jgi:mannose-6-phosphate isomerase
VLILSTPQAHPDKVLAEKLHATQPQHYKDPNHKPEMAVALTDFEAMCGFRPLTEILDHLVKYPELSDIVGTVTPLEDDADYLKSIFSNFMLASEEVVHTKLEELVTRLSSAAPPPEGGLDALILRLNKDFPSDRGALCPLILNYITLSPGQFCSDVVFTRCMGAYTQLDCIIIIIIH